MTKKRNNRGTTQTMAKNTLSEDKEMMKGKGMGFMAVIALALVFGACGVAGAEEKTEAAIGPAVKQTTEKQNLPGDTARKMNIDKYDETARGVNAPMYDYYAGQIKTKTRITKGTCLDVGCGGGYLGLSLAKITDLNFVFLDISPEAIDSDKKAHR